MPETIIHFFEAEPEAVGKFYEYRTADVPVLMIGPTTLLTSAATKIEAIAAEREYFLVVASHADAVADPPISAPP